MRTNHRRGFVADHDNPRRYCAPAGVGAYSELADCTIGASYGGDCSNGHRGYSRQKHGAKKYVRTRIRFHENTATQKMARTMETDECQTI